MVINLATNVVVNYIVYKFFAVKKKQNNAGAGLAAIVLGLPHLNYAGMK